MTAAIRITGLEKRFRDKLAVDQLELEVEEGELLALLGVNGAGKTTTIRMLTGLSKPTGGDAFLLGHSIRSDMGKIKPLINLSPQETAVAPNLTVTENLLFFAEIYGFSKNNAFAKTEAILSSLALETVRNQKAKILSGGWQRRLSIALALISEPRILFLDEPTLGLDVLARRELWKVIASLKGKMTILLTTHYMEEAESLSDRIAILAAGRKKAHGTAARLKQQTGALSLEDAFIAIAEGEVE